MLLLPAEDTKNLLTLYKYTEPSLPSKIEDITAAQADNQRSNPNYHLSTR
mgnify:CR=1 FL=1